MFMTSRKVGRYIRLQRWMITLICNHSHPSLSPLSLSLLLGFSLHSLSFFVLSLLVGKRVELIVVQGSKQTPKKRLAIITKLNNLHRFMHHIHLPCYSILFACFIVYFMHVDDNIINEIDV